MHLPIAPSPAPIVVRRYVLKAPEGAEIPFFAGSSVRGALGRALRKLVCATRLPTCDGCVVRDACSYASLHDGFTPESLRCGTGKHAPPPMWIRDLDDGGPRSPGEEFAFSIAAYGPAVRALPFVDEAVRGLAKLGIGKGRLPLSLHSIQDETRAEADVLLRERVRILREETRGGSPLAVRLTTPVAIRLKGPEWDTPAKPLPSWPERLIGGAVRRRAALERRWLEALPMAVPRMSEALKDASGVEVVKLDVHARRVPRYSTTEDRFVEFRGAVGTIHLRGAGLDKALPWLATAELFSVGSCTTFGFGRIQLGAGSFAPGECS